MLLKLNTTLITYDYIILGAGASGLLLAYRMSQDAFFDDKSILIIDQVKNKGNDRTWCYWENGVGEWDALVSKKWSKVYFGSAWFSKTIPIIPFQYKMIRSGVFYDTLWKEINTKSNISFVEGKVNNVSEQVHSVIIETTNGKYKGTNIFNSLPNSDIYKSQDKYPLIHQHFVGWFIKTPVDTFDDSKATFMDFSVSQNGNTRFMYVLPIDKKTALFEYTLFSKELLEYRVYEEAIKRYLDRKNIVDYTIIEKEKGNIPMTSFKFNRLNSNRILHIGTAGGWTKASTGYTFTSTSKKTKDVVEFLKKNQDLSTFNKRTKYRFYDLIFLDVLAKHNNEGAALFSSMFKKADVTTIFRFLDEESTLIEDLKIILSVPPKRFIQAFLKRLF
ncbi:lycopene cyclase family protein [Winogradskyella sediminis]|uniref:lycopene cyclase family protein n=1 Tax=Winogradskyella sediminis TaxID=1382466 RepID=UPI003AA9DD96